MKGNRCVKLFLIVAMTAMLGWGGLSPLRATETRPNVVFILADDLGYGDLSCYGQEKFETPHIDRLAHEGIRFTNAYSGNTVCSPSRASLMTGQSPGACYLRGNIAPEAYPGLDPEITVLPELFKAAGYATGAFGKWGLGETDKEGRESSLTHGFDEFYGPRTQTEAHTYFPTQVIHNGKAEPLEPGTYVHRLIVDQALRFIQTNARAGKPFFCYIPTPIPHAAMHAPPEIHEKWMKKLPQFNAKIGTYKAGKEPCPDVVNPIAGFAAMMEVLDDEVGRLLDTLKQLGIDDNTLVFFCSDNGAHHEGGHDPDFWNSTGGLRGGKRDMHEGGIRMPFLARWPGTIAVGRNTDHITALWDIVPTVAEILGQPVPSQANGLSLLPELTGTPGQKTHDFLYWEFTKGNPQKIFSQALRMGKWKAYVDVGQAMELFNLDEDPFEKNDIAGKHLEMIQRMEAAIVKATGGRKLEYVSAPKNKGK